MNQTVEKISQLEEAMDAMRRAMAGARERFIEGVQLTRTQLEIVMILTERSQTTRQLSTRLFITQSAVTQTIDTLVRRGLVERHPDAQDRRSVTLSLSEEGRGFTRRIRQLKRHHIKALLETLSASEVDVLIKVTKKLAELYDQAKPAKEN